MEACARTFMPRESDSLARRRRIAVTPALQPGSPRDSECQRLRASTQVVFSADPDLIVVRATVTKIACLVGSLLVAALGSTVLLVGRTSKR